MPTNHENPTPADDSYVSRPGHKGEPIGVVSDNDKIENPVSMEHGESDAQLARDENEAIDKSNIIDSRTRGAKPDGSYTEPGDEEGLPADDGTSRGAQ